MNLDSSVLVERRKLGKTGLEVSVLGLGLAQISRAASTKGYVSDSATVLNSALDLGINFLDTAACYGDTEQLIGQAVSHRRDEYILATKAGHVVDDTDNLPWTRKTIEESINRSLRLLRTEYVDLLQLHSCSVETLQSGEVIEAVQKIQQTGKARFIGYSGDNEAARWAACSGVFQTLQTSYNVVDQHFKIKNTDGYHYQTTSRKQRLVGYPRAIPLRRRIFPPDTDHEVIWTISTFTKRQST